MSRTAIEWTDEVWNPVTGCTKVSTGCKHCYAERLFPRVYGHQRVEDGPSGQAGDRLRRFTDVALHPDRLNQPLRWRKPRRVFVNSMSDLFHEDVPDEFIHSVFCVMRQARRHTFQVLTKRPERMRSYVTGWHGSALEAHPNIWLGVSVEDQEAADGRIPQLVETPVAVRFLSCEPLLGKLNLSPWLGVIDRAKVGRTGPGLGDMDPMVGVLLEQGRDEGLAEVSTECELLQWVIVGGESGPGARPMHPFWPLSIRDQCDAAGVPFFFKQWGEWAPKRGDALQQRFDASTREVHSWSEGLWSLRFGKKIAGRELGGRTWDEMPEAPHA